MVGRPPPLLAATSRRFSLVQVRPESVGEALPAIRSALSEGGGATRVTILVEQSESSRELSSELESFGFERAMRFERSHTRVLRRDGSLSRPSSDIVAWHTGWRVLMRCVFACGIPVKAVCNYNGQWYQALKQELHAWKMYGKARYPPHL